MKLPLAVGIISQLAISWNVAAFTTTRTRNVYGYVNPTTNSNILREPFFLSAIPPKGGLSFEEEEKNTQSSVPSDTIDATNNAMPPASSTGPPSPFQDRGKLNEIDFCMSPADVSLSRLYQSSPSSNGSFTPSSVAASPAGAGKGTTDENAPRLMSLTRALNNASNRAVRRILLSRSWPSPEALNISLRQVLASGSKQNSSPEESVESASASGNDDENSAKCPIPRPILNIIVKEQDSNKSRSSNAVTDGKSPEVTSSAPLGRKGTTDEQWVEDQLIAFRETYGDVEGYEFSEAYMECILNLATSGVESPRVSEVMDQGVYEDAYRRIISVLKSVGVTFEGVEDTKIPRMRIAPKLRDQDICLSILDKINLQNDGGVDLIIPKMVLEEKVEVEEVVEQVEEVVVEEVKEEEVTVIEEEVIEEEVNADAKDKRNNLADKFLSWMTKKDKQETKRVSPSVELKIEADVDESQEEESIEETEKIEEIIKPEDLGGVLLSKEEPTITRQLNVLSNIVKRTLLFGGDQEILVLSKTLEADRSAFIQQWYPDTAVSDDDLENEIRPGVQFFDCLVQLLTDCYNNGVVTSLDPSLPLISSYANSYERLTALLAELGSGYVKPTNDNKILSKKPKNPTEEFIRFSQWEVALRQTQPDVSDLPSDLVGSWQVKDEVGGKVIGTSTVIFKPEGKVVVSPPLKGLQWRLDPGPTHLDTCTFQVLSEDGAILQYRGFLDRGARLESRFSKRSIKIRGAVAFQMRDSEAALVGNDYKRDLLPIEIQSGTTRFVMSKVFDV